VGSNQSKTQPIFPVTNWVACKVRRGNNYNLCRLQRKQIGFGGY